MMPEGKVKTKKRIARIKRKLVGDPMLAFDDVLDAWSKGKGTEPWGAPSRADGFEQKWIASIVKGLLQSAEEDWRAEYSGDPPPDYLVEAVFAWLENAAIEHAERASERFEEAYHDVKRGGRV